MINVPSSITAEPANKETKKLLAGIAMVVVSVLIMFAMAHTVGSAERQENNACCQSGTSTIGYLTGNVNVANVKYGIIDTKLYSYTYGYTVQGREYTVSKSDRPTTVKPEITVWYDKNHPAEVKVDDPCKWMAKNGSRITVNDRFHNIVFFCCIVAFLLGLYFIGSAVFHWLINLLTKPAGR